VGKELPNLYGKRFLPLYATCIVALLWIVVPSAAHGENTSLVSCEGPEDADVGLVYLHGMDSPSPSPQEMSNRAVLEAVARHFSMRVAILRSLTRCSWRPEQLCWSWRDRNQLLSRHEEIVRKSAPCFAKEARLILLGFSNGAFFATDIANRCVPTPFSSVIAFGGGTGAGG